MQTKKGQSIEDESMEIIEREVGSHPYLSLIHISEPTRPY